MFRPLHVVLALLLWSTVARAADEPWKFRGFLEFRSLLYAGKPAPADTRAQGLARVEFSIQRKSERWGRLFLSASGEIDTHHDIDRQLFFDWNERDVRRSAAGIREVYWEKRLGPLDLRMGRQEIRWGRADGFNPTDNSEPYDFLNPFVERRLPVTAASGNLYWKQATFEFHWLPLFSPSRLPLLGQRWFPGLPSEVVLQGQSWPVRYQEGRTVFPALNLKHSQVGLRWNQLVPGAEFSFSYFDAFNDLPFFPCSECLSLSPDGITARLDREYHRQRIIGADFATQFHGWGLRGEAAQFLPLDRRDAGYFSYVVGVDHQAGRWFTILEFLGQWITRQGTAPQPVSFDRGLGRALIWRSQVELRTDESLEWTVVVRIPSGDTAWRMAYLRKLSDRWQLELRGSAFAGNPRQFLGQYNDSGNLETVLTCRW